MDGGEVRRVGEVDHREITIMGETSVERNRQRCGPIVLLELPLLVANVRIRPRQTALSTSYGKVIPLNWVTVEFP